ncbi:MAG: hypothetical protein Kapaf2KO_01230 [Candidatus Kapaibacteriales bacterium]
MSEYKTGSSSLSNKSIYVKDSNDYSKAFLKEIEVSGLDDIYLIDSILILSRKDTVIFPREPQIGEITVLTAKKNDLAVALTIQRINQSTIDYKIEIVQFGSTNYSYEGQADLNAQFYLGAEIDISSLSGMSYHTTEFSDNQDSCYTYIRLGKDESSGSFLLGKIQKNCNGSINDIRFDNFPSLIEK